MRLQLPKMMMQRVVCLRWGLAMCFLAVSCWPSSVGALPQGSEKKSFALFNGQAWGGSLHREARGTHGEKVRVVRQAPGVKTYSADETESLLDTHMMYRRNVTPSAADMNKIVSHVLFPCSLISMSGD